MASVPPTITVIAGVNGAGKSSVAGAALREQGGDYHNPDEVTRAYLARGLSEAKANSRAWHRGCFALTRAVNEGRDFTFETTLGGNTMTELLMRAARDGMRIRMIYVGLASAEGGPVKSLPEPPYLRSSHGARSGPAVLGFRVGSSGFARANRTQPPIYSSGVIRSRRYAPRRRHRPCPSPPASPGRTAPWEEHEGLDRSGAGTQARRRGLCACCHR